MFHDFLEWQCEIGALSTQLCGRFLKAVNWELWLLTDHTLEVLHHAYAIFITMGTCFTLERTKKQYPSGSCTQDIYNFASSAVFTGHLMVDPYPPPPPLPCDASFLKENFVFKWLQSPSISLCYEIPGLISALSNSENRFWSWFIAMFWSWFESYRVCHQTTSPDKVSAH